MGNDWKIQKLDELIIKRNQGVNTTTEKVKYSESGKPVIRANNISQGRIDFSDCVFVDDVTFQRIKEPCKPKKGDVLYTNIGSKFGSASKVESDFEFTIAWNVLRIQVSKDLDADFLVYLLNNPKNKAFIQSLNSSSTMPFVSGTVIGDIEFLFPDYDTQQRIVAKLKPLDDKIDLNRRANQTFEQMARALFKSWFVDFDPVIDNALAAGSEIPDALQHRFEIRKKAHALQKQNPNIQPLPEATQGLFPSEFEHCGDNTIGIQGWIPKGWQTKSVDESININPRISLPKGTLAKFADMKALPTSGYGIMDVIEKSYTGGAKFQQGDVLLARITPCLQNGKTGIVDFMDDDNEVGFGSTEFIVMRRKGGLETPFISCLARDESFRNHCMQSMVGSSGRQRIQNACFSAYFLVLPTTENLLNTFQTIVAPMFTRMTINNEEIKSLANLRDLLLPKLISGEITI